MAGSDTEEAISTRVLDFAELVGKRVTVHSEQYPDRPLEARVLSYTGSDFEVSSGDAFMSNLVNRQSVVLKFDYKGQTVAVTASVKRSAGGRLYLTPHQSAIPLNRRRFARIELSRPVHLAACPLSSSTRIDLSKLRWLETETLNFSSGGALIRMASAVSPGIYFLIHVDVKDGAMPDMILAVVRHCYQNDITSHLVGVEFIVREALPSDLIDLHRDELPTMIFKYTAKDRDRLNDAVQGWTQTGLVGD
jgi:c-di-GMP-binding flagellar brake protein YcgR